MFILLILFFLFLISNILLVGLLVSKMKVQINDFEYNSKRNLKPLYDVKISVYIFNIIKFLTIRSNNKNIYINGIRISKEKLRKKGVYGNILKKLYRSDKFYYIKEKLRNDTNINFIKKIEFEINELNSYLEFGTFDILLTTSIVTFFSTIFPIIIKEGIKKYEKEKYQYEIKANYTSTNIISLKIHCIITIKIAHIIHMIYKTKKKERGENGRTSNRRINENCNE